MNLPISKTIEQALTDYGYREDRGYWVREGAPTDIWNKGPHGWRKLAPASVSFGGGIFGRQCEIPGYVEVPYKQAMIPVSGEAISPATHPDYYDWVWPEEQIIFIYEYAVGQDADRGNLWIKVQNEDGSISMVRDES